VVRNQEYVGLQEIEAALTEIYFYHIRKHLLPESMFTIKQQKFFLSFLVLLPSVSADPWSILWIHLPVWFQRGHPVHLQSPGCPSPFSSILEHLCSSTRLGGGS